MSNENENTPANQGSVSEPDCAESAGSRIFEVNYFARGKWSHKYTERWEAMPELHCPGCGEKRVWHETSGGDYYVEEKYMCAACGSGWYLPGGVRKAKDDEQGCQRFAAISSNTQVRRGGPDATE